MNGNLIIKSKISSGKSHHGSGGFSKGSSNGGDPGGRCSSGLSEECQCGLPLHPGLLGWGLS